MGTVRLVRQRRVELHHHTALWLSIDLKRHSTNRFGQIQVMLLDADKGWEHGCGLVAGGFGTVRRKGQQFSLNPCRPDVFLPFFCVRHVEVLRRVGGLEKEFVCERGNEIAWMAAVDQWVVKVKQTKGSRRSRKRLRFISVKDLRWRLSIHLDCCRSTIRDLSCCRVHRN